MIVSETDIVMAEHLPRCHMPPAEPPWKYVCLIVLLYVGAALLTTTLNRYTISSIASLAPNLLLLTIAIYLAQQKVINIWGGAFLFTWQRKVVAPAALGIILLVLANIFGSIHFYSDKREFLVQACSKSLDTWYSLTQGLLISPIVEEILFTGLLFGACRKRINLYGAVVVTAFAFSLLHLPKDVHQFFNRIAYETLACAMLIFTGNLVASIILHMLVNLSLFIFDQLEKPCEIIVESNIPLFFLWFTAVTLSLFLAWLIIARRRPSVFCIHV